MKTAFVLLAAAGAALAQGDLSALPECGVCVPPQCIDSLISDTAQQTCISNMQSIAQNQFGCAANDAVCYCGNANFGYGIRDCASEACGSQEDAAQVISYGTSYCERMSFSLTDGVDDISC